MKRPSLSELKAYNCHYAKDTDFAAHARLLQGKWREKKGYPINIEKRHNYGNFIETAYAKNEGVNFITANTKRLVSDKILEIRRNGGLVGEPRIWNNLLSSQPLCFNLFGELHYDLDLATTVFRQLFPVQLTKDSKVTKVDFEFSSRRGLPDNSAFDVFVEYSRNATKGFFGIEVKYQESLIEETAKIAKRNFDNHKEHYIALTEAANIYAANAIEELQLVPIAQIWRDHLLTFNMAKDYDEGFFIFLYPFDNAECAQGVREYKSLLNSADDYQNRFYTIDLGRFIQILHTTLQSAWTNELADRYLG